MSDATSLVGRRATFTPTEIKNTPYPTMKDLSIMNAHIELRWYPFLLCYNSLLLLETMKIKLDGE